LALQYEIIGFGISQWICCVGFGTRGDVSSTNGSAPEHQESDESDEDCAWEPRNAA